MEHTLGIWSDDIATVYRERLDGRIVMIPLESPKHQSTLGERWTVADFKNNPNYRAITEQECRRLVEGQ